MENDFAGKGVLVSGGTSGIGFAIAKMLARRSAVVAISGRTAETGEAAAAQLREISDGCFYVQAHASDAASAAASVSVAAERMEKLDVLVSAGAYGSVGPALFADMTPDQIESSFRERLLAKIFPVHAAIPYLRKSGAAAIVMITTDAARHPTPGESVIGGVGAAIILLTKALARELSRDAIRVNSVALTLTSDTPAWDRMFSKPGFGNDLFSKALARFPQGRPPNADEVAEAAAFLASTAATQVTGQTISVNGGLSFGGW
ncbi:MULTISPECIES: SDR family oxidoreductase [unclassified Variovorax]|uniref:SDR family NAD(P)-dependent oxidoreductase n=1 Tax=unclassified Variovorax TaxID=663243 RepID=UPI00076CDB58|nr:MULTISPECIES: SDR family oxidoreductase [unclassified Variovorax]KWT82098.1 3-oxoacyl-[acyl-carrier protein] reductase [Variovorax sp. WDL1]PNG46022.1 4-formylbenzenesulfonate dehydrogenase TsaC1/TsaC2 [Variovorax sp. B2]PNG46306.1 4-formylbenzenesulfonate dehydrogenase TsaC1/TsaC2 [Variovorax sp. B4]VTV19122.1 4-formylbenzenesulfonate dehydrogenase TsaC1/TsaC2 [Variovorax sp. WDL1]